MQQTTKSTLISLFRSLLISTLIALLAVLAYFVLPERKLQLLPAFPNESHLFFDGQQGGKTLAQWTDQQALKFTCSATTPTAETPYCGLSIDFHRPAEGVDYSKFQRIVLKIGYQGNNNRLRVKMHNFHPAEAGQGARETLQGMEVSFLASETSQLLSFNNSGWGNFSQGSSVDLSLDLVPPIAPGEHQLQLEYVEVHGKLLGADSWYLAVALAWLLANLFFISRHLLHQEKRIDNHAQRLSSLTMYSKDLQQESQHYKLMSKTDPLTGALNRFGFAAEMNQIAPTGKIESNTSLLIIDLDHFKRINDNYGHDAGDLVLSETVKIITGNTRASDRFVRWGGEEFILYCQGTNAQQALLVAEKIRLAIEAAQIVYNDKKIPITISIGLGVALPEEDFDDLFKRTDQALYKAKSLGRNCIVQAELSS